MSERDTVDFLGGDSGDEPWDETRLLAALDALDVDWRIARHPPLFTVEDSRQLRGDLAGLHVKNMFLKDKKRTLWLVTVLESRRFRIRDLEKVLGATKASFASPDLLWTHLGVRPGAVTPFAVVNDRGVDAAAWQPRGSVRVALDAALRGAARLNCHPLHNEATVTVSEAGLSTLLTAAGHPPTWVDCDALEDQEAARRAEETP